MDISITLKEDRRREQLRAKNLPFASQQTDHMFVMHFDGEQWHSPEIRPYGSLGIMPGEACINYGMQVYEGLMAQPHSDGELHVFRLDDHVKRLNLSASRMALQLVPESMQKEAILSLLDLERLWVPPAQDQGSIYIRPLLLARDDVLGVRPNHTFTYSVILRSSGPYYSEGFQPVKLLVTDRYHRAAPGGVGAAKAGGNYGAALRPQEYARMLGATEVLYLDARNDDGQPCVSEASVMNTYFVRDIEIWPTALMLSPEDDTVMSSITAKTVHGLSSRLGVQVNNEKLSLFGLVHQVANGSITEAGGLGTAAGVTPVNGLILDQTVQKMLHPPAQRALEESVRVQGGGRNRCIDLTIGDGEIGPVTKDLYDLVTGIKSGRVPDPHEWLTRVEHRE